MTQYVYLIPKGGFNDTLTSIRKTLAYCEQYNKVLLLNTMRGCYNINWSDYFCFNRKNMIEDINIINEITKSLETIYPIEIDITDFKNNKLVFRHIRIGNYSKYVYNDVILDLPIDNIESQCIITVSGGIGNGFSMIKELTIKNPLRDIINERYSKLKTPYLAIQVRNTDYKCDYEKIYTENLDLIHSYKTIYIATDNKEVLEFYTNKNINYYNFTSFPTINSINLHYSNVPPEIKITDVICDLFILALSETLISNSVGGFIRLARDCKSNKHIMRKHLSI